MRFKLLYRLFFILLILSCQKQTSQDILKFEEILGERKIEALNLLVSDFEDNLEKVYPDLSQQLAYEQYMKDLIDPKENNWEKFDFQTDETHKEFINSGLRDEIYTKSKEYDLEREDSIIGLDVNQMGKYMQALFNVRESDSLVYGYWDKRRAGGLMQNELIANGILYYKPNFNNYLHKRIVVVEFSF